MPPSNLIRYVIEYDPVGPVSRFIYTNDEGNPAKTIKIETDKAAGKLKYVQTGRVQYITPKDLDLILSVFSKWLSEDAVQRIGIPPGVDENTELHIESSLSEHKLTLASAQRGVVVTHDIAANTYEIKLTGGGTPQPTPMTAWRGTNEMMAWKARKHQPFTSALPPLN